MIPLIDKLIARPVPDGSFLLVEFDPASRWENAALYMAAEWMRSGGHIGCTTLANPPAKIRSQLGRMGLHVEELEK